MRKVAKLLTDYVIKKSMVDEADREVYEYGFVITLEGGLFLVASLFIALKLDMVLEGIFFFVIFSPLRSYAGGLHLEKFWICFVLSCLTYITTLLPKGWPCRPKWLILSDCVVHWWLRSGLYAGSAGYVPYKELFGCSIDYV